MNFLKRDLKDEAKILRKRLNEEERKKRIFDPRVRVIGVDVNGLNQQLEEKCKKYEKERRDKEAYERKKLQEDHLSIELERNLERKRKEVEKRLIEFRQVYQKPADGREFDLNDPDFLKKSTFDRNSFDGEDETRSQREAHQKEQTRAWLLQQMSEKKRIQEQLQLAESEMVQLQLTMDARSKQLSGLEDQCRRKLQEATLQFNMLQAQEKRAEKQMMAAKQAEIEAQEVKNWVTGSFLTEDPSVARSAFGPNRVIAYMYKGEPPEKEMITQKEQVDQMKRTRARESQENADKEQWEQYEKSIQSEATKKFSKLIQEQRELDNQLVFINSQLAEQQKRREAKNNDISDLYPTSEFFQQFNRSTY